MAKKSRTSRPGSAIPQRSLARGLLPWTSRPVNLSLFQDLRTWHPEGPARPAFAKPRSAARIVVSRGRQDRARRMGESPHPGLSFAAPDKVVLCVRRKRRKQVLFAKKKTGKGSRAKKRRRNYWSSISCKR